MVASNSVAGTLLAFFRLVITVTSKLLRSLNMHKADGFD